MLKKRIEKIESKVLTPLKNNDLHKDFQQIISHLTLSELSTLATIIESENVNFELPDFKNHSSSLKYIIKVINDYDDIYKINSDLDNSSYLSEKDRQIIERRTELLN